MHKRKYRTFRGKGESQRARWLCCSMDVSAQLCNAMQEELVKGTTIRGIKQPRTNFIQYLLSGFKFCKNKLRLKFSQPCVWMWSSGLYHRAVGRNPDVSEKKMDCIQYVLWRLAVRRKPHASEEHMTSIRPQRWRRCVHPKSQLFSQLHAAMKQNTILFLSSDYWFDETLAILLPLYYLDGLPLWSCGQSSWVQTQRSGFDCRRYHIFWELAGLWNGVHSASWVQLRSYLKEKVAAPV
jgi:hypothetical protein